MQIRKLRNVFPDLDICSLHSNSRIADGCAHGIEEHGGGEGDREGGRLTIIFVEQGTGVNCVQNRSL